MTGKPQQFSESVYPACHPGRNPLPKGITEHLDCGFSGAVARNDHLRFQKPQRSDCLLQAITAGVEQMKAADDGPDL
jgi:hypothetical protein